MKTLAIGALMSIVAFSVAPAAEEPEELKTASGTIYGTLLTPDTTARVPVVLIIAGSGPTDRNGNNPMLPGANNSLKMLAEGLASNGIASLRFDKRGIGASKAAMVAEKDLRFDNYVGDAAAWVAKLTSDRRFSRVVIAGHSEGALIGTIVAQKGAAAALVVIAGVSRPADVVLRGQLAGKLPPDLADASEKILAALKGGRTVDDVPKPLFALYRPSVQPYLISWFHYDPAAELAKVRVPVLIIQGTTDIQVSVDDARALAAAQPHARLDIIDGMNHVLKTASGDASKQMASYGDPNLPLASGLVDVIAQFVRRDAEAH
ncbi:MAG TPA: alpha/beta fold hydrolase [Thermoanaerobaculia bacterium]|nr:alpha/beta fold hydrolase [Thermoanaerobaculia bacterium]